jgi:hypothetical protein
MLDKVLSLGIVALGFIFLEFNPLVSLLVWLIGIVMYLGLAQIDRYSD